MRESTWRQSPRGGDRGPPTGHGSLTSVGDYHLVVSVFALSSDLNAEVKGCARSEFPWLLALAEGKKVQGGTNILGRTGEGQT